MSLSKSRYTLAYRCPKLLWLSLYKKEEEEDLGNAKVFENGTMVGDLARSLFGKYTLIDYNKGIEQMIEDTKKAINNKDKIICEASFNYQNNFCSVDILRREKNGFSLYEVKSSTHINEVYLADVSYQTWILKKLGYNIIDSYIVIVNNDYVFKDKLDIKKFFKIIKLTDEIDLSNISENVQNYMNIINMKEEPSIDLSLGCHSPYDCPFFKYCTRNLGEPNVFSISGLSFAKKLKLYKEGFVLFKDLINKDELNDKIKEQILFELNDLDDKIDKKYIKNEIDSYTYPLYFLDFESYEEAVPKFNGTRPYQQITFQYSLHYYLKNGGELYHKEYLSSDYNDDPRIKLAEKLCQDIPKDVTVLAYNMSFEKTRIKEMALLCPGLKEHLMNIHDNMKDLLPIFNKRHYYSKNMQGKSTIKYVLPSLFPNDPQLNYHNLEQVHKGDEASNAYLSLSSLNPDEETRLRNNMLKYCCLDTYAMVKIYNKLKEAVK